MHLFPLSRRAMLRRSGLLLGAAGALAGLKSVGRVAAESAATPDAVLAMGEPSEQIIKLSRERQVDLIAMSTHGHRFLKDVLLGQTVEKVRHTVEVPVLLLKART